MNRLCELAVGERIEEKEMFAGSYVDRVVTLSRKTIKEFTHILYIQSFYQ